MRFVWEDDRNDYGEERLNVVGLIDGFEIPVTYTLREEKVESYPRGGQTAMSEKIIGETEFELDLKKLPQMTEEQMARLRAMTDEEIDYSDTPSQAGKLGRRSPGMSGGPAGGLRRAALAEKLLLVEPDVLEFFNASGDGAPERMNAVLREYVEQQRKRA